MFRKKLNKQILLLIIIIGLFFVLLIIFTRPATLVNSVPMPITNKEPLLSATETTSFSLPTNLIIPNINVNSPIEYVGLTPEGAMDVPKDQSNVAWLQTSTRPGETGTAVIDGHYGWKDKKPSAFDNLYKLRSGDKILVKDEKGVDIYFIVRELKRYSYGANAEAVFISNDDKSHLNLITCEGTWDQRIKGFSTRLVIFADKITE